jgi:hypothetical protein
MASLHATGLEAERERATHLSRGPDTGPLLRTIQRLRHDVVMIGRASVVPLPANVQARLARPLSDVSNAIVDYMRAAAASLAKTAAAPWTFGPSMRRCRPMPRRSPRCAAKA